MSPRRLRNRERTIESILQTAREIIREQGVASLTMQELAQRMEMRPPSLYNYFSGIMEIYDALFRLGFILWGDHLKAYSREAQRWQEEVQALMEAYLTFARENPELYQLCFERPVPGFVPSAESLQISFGLLEYAYERAASIKADLQSDLPPEQIADLIIAITHGLTSLHMANEPDLPPGQGRFGSLIPAALSVLDKAWSNV
jgi:AcrR family transcriptional regulator